MSEDSRNPVDQNYPLNGLNLSETDEANRSCIQTRPRTAARSGMAVWALQYETDKASEQGQPVRSSAFHPYRV
ncbi:hypothetical protein M8J77_011003 [Diaphorina citri]|nr:hypothetical protein M8J77_016662 [Diaphorina citri]KAI5753603.1 hypothetical protein M8J77_001710 [Diaphorina citri]KAI5754734.1 hypothetical protein M8J77_011003 [Diaphorina citri]